MDLSRAQWRKSIRSGSESNCVELADAGPAVAVRDSKDPDGPRLAFTRGQWSAFTRHLETGGLTAAA